MDDRSVDAIISLVNRKSESGTSTILTGEELPVGFGFFKTRGETSVQGKSLLANGGFEMSKPFTIDPSYWSFQNSVGLVVPYAGQPNSESSEYVSATASGVPSSSGAVLANGTSLIQARLVSSGVWATIDSDETEFSSPSNSSNFLVVSPSATSGISVFSASVGMTVGALSEDELYRLSFTAKFYPLWFNSPTFVYGSELLIPPAYRSAEGVPILSLEAGDVSSMGLQSIMDFYDSDNNLITSYKTPVESLPHGVPPSSFEYMFRAPKGVSNVVITLSAEINPYEPRVSLFVDEVAVYSISTNKVPAAGYSGLEEALNSGKTDVYESRVVQSRRQVISPVLIDQIDPSITYSASGWSAHGAITSCYGGSYRYTNIASDASTVSYTFEGNRLDWYCRLYTTFVTNAQIKLEVSVDSGSSWQTYTDWTGVNCGTTVTNKSIYCLWSTGFLPFGVYRVTGRAHTGTLSIDYLKVFGCTYDGVSEILYTSGVYIDSNTGDDATADGTSELRYKTFSAAMSEVDFARYVPYKDTFTIHLCGTFDETIVIDGFMGGGSVAVMCHTGAGNLPVRMTDGLVVTGCSVQVYVRGADTPLAYSGVESTGCMAFITSDSMDKHAIMVKSSVDLFASILNVSPRSTAYYGLYSDAGSTAYCSYTEFNNCGRVIAASRSRASIRMCRGSNNSYLYDGNTGAILSAYTYPVATTLNGGLDVDSVYWGGGSAVAALAGGSTPSVTTIKTATFVTTNTASWRPNYGWRSDNDYVYQGEWAGGGNHVGIWWFNTSSISSKTITKVVLRVKRRNAGGYSADTKHYFYKYSGNFKSGSATSYDTAISTVSGDSSWAWGQEHGVTLYSNSTGTVWFGSGSVKGIAIRASSSASLYSQMYGKSGYSATLTVTYKA